MKREWRQALFDGYLESDGCILSNGKKTTSISLPLTTGMKILASGLGKASSVTYSMPKRKLCVIEGRIVNEHGFYSQTYYSNSRSALISKDGFWGLVRKKLPGRKNIRVYNLEVEDDHSYVAAGIAVHNCQSFSVAGKREGLAGASGLMFEYIRAVRELRPRWFVWENVPGAFTSERGGEAYRQLLSEMDALGYGLAWRVLDAQFFSAWPKDASVCSLLEVLEPCVARKYFLSAKACRGIISRADRRGKPLPKRLRNALEKQIMILAA